MTSTYLVIFTWASDAEIQPQQTDQFWTIQVRYAQNAKDARHKAWKAVNRNPGLKFIKRGGWRISHSGRAQDIHAAGPLRAPGISIK